VTAAVAAAAAEAGAITAPEVGGRHSGIAAALLQALRSVEREAYHDDAAAGAHVAAAAAAGNGRDGAAREPLAESFTMPLFQSAEERAEGMFFGPAPAARASAGAASAPQAPSSAAAARAYFQSLINTRESGGAGSPPLPPLRAGSHSPVAGRTAPGGRQPSARQLRVGNNAQAQPRAAAAATTRGQAAVAEILRPRLARAKSLPRSAGNAAATGTSAVRAAATGMPADAQPVDLGDGGGAGEPRAAAP
jgi:hypothetical protein